MLSTANPQPAIEEKKRSSRQRPGTACLECRSRKLRCDGSQPRCEKCVSSGVECTPTTKNPRGPKKGYLRVLQNRIEMLEQRLVETQGHCGSEADSAGFCPEDPLYYNTEPLLDLNDLCISQEMFGSTQDMSIVPIGMEPGQITTPALSLDTGNSSPMNPVGSSDSADPQIEYILSDDFLRTDLNQLYFERVQRAVPILHQATYFSWARSSTKTEAQVCLQYAMWTLAASLSSQLQEVRETLYRFTQVSLELLESKDETLLHIEHVQARLLICIHEMMRKNHYRAWMSAGRCFRLLQLMRLHDIDGADSMARREHGSDGEHWIRQEERRRTFWVAYALDMFISVRGSWSPTLNEQNISTRLPMPETEFQNSVPVEMPSVTDPSQVLDAPQQSSFAEFVILACIIRHLVVHRQRAPNAGVAAGGTPDYASFQTLWGRHSRLVETVKTRASLLVQSHRTCQCQFDPVLLFTRMMLNAVLLCLCNILEGACGDLRPEDMEAIKAFQHHCLQVSRSISELSRSLAQLSYLKMHPLTPLPLTLCLEFLDAHRYLDESTDLQIKEIRAVLHEISNVNNLALEYLSDQKTQLMQ